MPANVLMPALSPTMEKGKLAKWLKKEGDKVKSGDVLAEIETDKATMEVEAVDEGTLGKIMVPAGTEDVLVNTLIAVILGEGEKAGDVTAAAAPAAMSPAIFEPARPGSLTMPSTSWSRPVWVVPATGVASMEYDLTLSVMEVPRFFVLRYGTHLSRGTDVS